MSQEQFVEQFEIGLQIQHDKKYFEQLVVAEDFEKFKKQMVRMNKDLELQALKELQEEEIRLNRINPGNTYSIEQNKKQMERMELEQYTREIEEAIARSLAVDSSMKTQLDQEDEEFKKALMLSQIEHQRQIDQQDEENRIFQEKLKLSYNEELERQAKEQKLKKEEEEKKKIEEQKRQMELSKKELEIEKIKQQKEHEEKIQKQKQEQKQQEEEKKKQEEESKKIEELKIIEQKKLDQQKSLEEQKKIQQEREQELKKKKEEEEQELKKKKEQEQLRIQQEAALAQAKAQEPNKKDVPVIESTVIQTGLILDIEKKKQPDSQKLEAQTIQIEESKKQLPQFKGIQQFPVLGKEGMANNPKKTIDPMSLQDLMKERQALKEKLEKMQQEDEQQKLVQLDKKKEEDLAERKKRLLQQRELILQKKKLDREKDLKNYQMHQEQIKGNEPQLKLQNFIGVSDNKQNEQKEKQFELYSKIQSNLNQD